MPRTNRYILPGNIWHSTSSGGFDFFDFQLAGMPVCLPQVIGHLQPQPGLRPATKGLRQADGHFSGDAALAK